MSTRFTKETTSPSPHRNPPAKVQVHALPAGHLTLPEKSFVYPASDAKYTVPSLAFLIQHKNIESGKTTRIVFDLGLRRDLKRYSEPIQRHAATRQPISTGPDVVTSLKAGGLSPDDIDFVIYSHVHWDHVGEPRDFPRGTFIVGNGALDLLRGKSSLRGSHSFFESDLIPEERTIELCSPNASNVADPDQRHLQAPGIPNFNHEWTSHLHLPHVIDTFSDGSLYIVDAPGHLLGHINLLARTASNERVYLAGDACHDRRILRKEKQIGTWRDSEGYTCCIHANLVKAEETIESIRELEKAGVEVIFAHDVEWELDPRNKKRFWGS